MGASGTHREQDPTIAERLKPLGCVIGQFGNNHIGNDTGQPSRRRSILIGYGPIEEKHLPLLSHPREAEEKSGKVL